MLYNIVLLAREDIQRYIKTIFIPSPGGGLFAPFCVMCGKRKPVFAGKLHKRRIPPALPSRKTDKTAPARVHDTNIALDVRPVVQSTYDILL